MGILSTLLIFLNQAMLRTACQHRAFWRWQCQRESRGRHQNHTRARGNSGANRRGYITFPPSLACTAVTEATFLLCSYCLCPFGFTVWPPLIPKLFGLLLIFSPALCYLGFIEFIFPSKCNFFCICLIWISFHVNPSRCIQAILDSKRVSFLTAGYSL